MEEQNVPFSKICNHMQYILATLYQDGTIPLQRQIFLPTTLTYENLRKPVDQK